MPLLKIGAFSNRNPITTPLIHTIEECCRVQIWEWDLLFPQKEDADTFLKNNLGNLDGIVLVWDNTAGLSTELTYAWTKALNKNLPIFVVNTDCSEIPRALLRECILYSSDLIPIFAAFKKWHQKLEPGTAPEGINFQPIMPDVNVAIRALQNQRSAKPKTPYQNSVPQKPTHNTDTEPVFSAPDSRFNLPQILFYMLLILFFSLLILLLNP